MVTRYEPGDSQQNKMVSFIRSMCGEHVLIHTILNSSAISHDGIIKLALHEVEKSQFTRSSHERAIESLSTVSHEIEELIQPAKGRRYST